MKLNPFKRKTEKKRIANRKTNSRNAYRKFNAGSTDNLTFAWGSGVVSADSEIRGGLDKLRARSRDLAINDPYFRKFLKLVNENVVGSQGIKLNMKIIEGIDKNGGVIFDNEASELIEQAWKEWGKKGNCTVDGKLNLKQAKTIIAQSLPRDGEIFIRKIKGFKGNSFRFAIQLLEADHLDTGFQGELTNGNYINMGIEYNSYDRPVAYHIFRRHPGDNASRGQGNNSNSRIRVPADEIIHLYAPERASQSRGFPWFCASALSSKHLNGYQEAELIAARVGAAKMGFYIPGEDSDIPADAIEEDSSGNVQLVNEIEPGIIEELPKGYDFKEFSPDHPNSAFKDFTKSVLRGIASGLGVGYNGLASDYEGVNFSSLRQSNLSERDFYRDIQDLLIQNVLDDIFSEWLLMSLTAGKIQLPITKFDKFNSPTWKARGWMWVDPLKEVKAHSEAISLNLKSATSVANEMGYDIEEVFKEKANEKRLEEKYGIKNKESSLEITDKDLEDEEEKN